MKDTLQQLLRECLKDAKSSKGGLDPNKYPSQVSTRVVSWWLGVYTERMSEGCKEQQGRSRP